MKRHQSKSAHAEHFMRGHTHHSAKPCDVLMRGHHASGGEAKPEIRVSRATGGAVNTEALHRADGGAADYGNLSPRFKKGGRAHRFTGGPTNLNDTMHMQEDNRDQQPQAPATAYKKGGHAHHHARRREHHFIGALAGALAPLAINALSGLFSKSEPSSRRRRDRDDDDYATGGKVNTAALNRAMGGAAKVRKGMMSEDGRDITGNRR